MVLFISAVAYDFQAERITIKYALTRSNFSKGIAPTQADIDYLQEEAKKRLRDDINRTRNPVPGEASSDYIML